MDSTQAQAYVAQLHDIVDQLVAPLEARHAARLRCGRGCAACCTDGLEVFGVEAALIAARHGELLATGDPHPAGACAMLDAEGACRIYADRPYVCRTQGLPLRWGDVGEAGEAVEHRDICPLNEEGGPALEELAAEECWTLGPIEQRLAAVQATQGEAERVSLRGLFASKG